MTIAIQTNQLSRHFGQISAVIDLALSINCGEIFGLLGPNASGKSTTIRMLSGIIQPSQGTAVILGLDLATQAELIKPKIGYVAQHFSLYRYMSVAENMDFYAGLYGIHDNSRLETQLTRFGLETYRNTMASHLSGGYQRRLAIACASMHDPQVIFLDEPTAGIDPATRKELWELFYALSAEGKTLFVTTHYMEEAERCHRLGFLNRGELIATDTPNNIRASLGNNQVYAAQIPYRPETTRSVMSAPGVILVNQFGSELRIVTDGTLSEAAVSSLVSNGQMSDSLVKNVSPSIEDAFMVLTMDKSKQ